MFTELKHIPEAWSKAWESRALRNQLLISVLALVLAGAFNFHWLRVWEARPGMIMNDWLLNQLPPIDFSWPIFIIEYSILLIVFIFILPHPQRLVRGLQMFFIVVLLRTATIYFIQLEPPADMIFLNDPVANIVLHSPGHVMVTKDLFFSGHIAAMTLLFLLTSNRYVKYLVLVCGVAISIMILWQHVHYTLDVIFAAIASYASYRLVEWVHTRVKTGVELQDA